MTMDVNDLRIVTTLLAFAVFIGIMVWAFSARNKEDFEAASKLPLDQD
jgi:cytochrome c oxidase cbb3-type subunit IV